MSIEIPDWVVETYRSTYRQNFVDGRLLKVEERIERALRAALDGWLVAKPVQWEPSGTKRVFIPEAPTATPNAAPVSILGRWETTYYWRSLLGGATKDDNPPSETLYTLRKDKTP